MSNTDPDPLVATEAPLVGGLKLPAPFAERLAGLERRGLSGPFGLQGFGVFQTRLPAGKVSGLRHSHSRRDEFVYLLEGELVLVGETGETPLTAGMCVGFPAGSAHHMVNRSNREAVYLEVTHAAAGDAVTFTDDDMVLVDSADGGSFTRKDGEPLAASASRPSDGNPSRG